MTTGNRSEYASHLGVSPAYVTKLGKQGRLVELEENGRRVVDFELSDRLVKNTADMARADNGANAAPRVAASVAPSSEGGRVEVIFRQAQAQERAYNAKLTELEYRQKVGQLVPVADVRKVAIETARNVREAVLAIPDRVVSILAAETDPARVHVILLNEIRQALSGLADRYSSEG